MKKKKEKMIVIGFTLPESSVKRLDKLQRKEKKKNRSILCREMMQAIIGAMEDYKESK